MSKFKLKGSLLSDLLLAFFLVSIITLIFIPMLSSLKSQYKENLKSIEIKRVIISSIQHLNKNELNQGVVIDKYEIQLFKDKICGKDTEFKVETCIFI